VSHLKRLQESLKRFEWEIAVSLARIARQLGLSVATVSRALGGFADVAPATRGRVIAEAERIGYQPNRLARALRGGQSATIGVVLPTTPGNFQEPFFLRFLAAIGPALARASLDLLVTTAPPGTEEVYAHRHLVEGSRVDGVVLIRPYVNDERVAWLQAHAVPFVVHGRTGGAETAADGTCPWVDVDGAAAFTSAVQRLAAAGHRHIALLNAPSNLFFATNRAAGWRAGLAQCGLTTATCREAEPTEENGYRLAADLLAGGDAPTAFLCANDRLAVGALRAASDAGLRPGHDVSVIGFDDLPAASWSHPALTTFAQPTEQAAIHIVDMLLQLLAGKAAEIRNVLLQAELIVRESDGPAPDRTTPGTGADKPEQAAGPCFADLRSPPRRGTTQGMSFMTRFDGLGLHLGNLSRLSDAESRSISPENFTGEREGGARATEGTGAKHAVGLGKGWKISPSVSVEPGETFTLADIAGPGAIQQIWMTLNCLMWRHVILRFYWDDQTVPSVECPAGDFFAVGWEKFAQVNSLAVCVNPGRGFNCYWEMPFRKRARITLTNISDARVTCYYQISYTLTAIPEDCAYFHAQFRRVNPLPFKQDYTILDGVRGSGHYVGTYLARGVNNAGWWGEGEIKFFLDGDAEFPTICGTGTEDYFGGAYDFDIGHQEADYPRAYTEFSTPYSGLQVIRPNGAYESQMRFGMYRWHITDPIRFKENLRVTLQSLGWRKDRRYLPLKDDFASVAYWYQTLPTVPFPEPPDRDDLEII